MTPFDILRIYLTVGFLLNMAYWIWYRHKINEDIQHFIRTTPTALPENWLTPVFVFATILALVWWTIAWPYLMVRRIARHLGYKVD